MTSHSDAVDRNQNEEEYRSPKSVFPAPPSHRAGDEFTTPAGERAVFVSENCYQIASTNAATALANGMVTPTYCLRKSKTPRGDLFDQLPAYRKYHPD